MTGSYERYNPRNGSPYRPTGDRRPNYKNLRQEEYIITGKQAVEILDRQYPSQEEGVFSKLIKEGDPREPLSPRTTMVFTIQESSYEDDKTIGRRAFEASVLGSAKSLLFKLHTLTQQALSMNHTLSNKDNAYLSYQNLVCCAMEAQKRCAVSYMQPISVTQGEALIKTDDTVIDVGSGMGQFSKVLNERGVEAISIEPTNYSRQTPETQNFTVLEYTKINPYKKFSVVNCSNIPVIAMFSDNTLDDFLKNCGQLVKENGQALFGVNAGDIESLSKDSKYYLKGKLLENFEEVAWIPAKQFKEYEEGYWSVGAQIGLYRCKKPREKPTNTKTAVGSKFANPLFGKSSKAH